MSEDRFIDIETKLAYQEDLLESLNQLVIKQQDRIDTLEHVCRKLLERLDEMKEAGEGSSEQQYEIPPHY